MYGSRFLVRRVARVVYFHSLNSKSDIDFLVEPINQLNMTGVETGYRAIRGDNIRNMVTAGFGFKIELTVEVAKL
jgi:hypothetical protein